ncbi:MAG: hypothetical protein JKX87_04740 [Cycloclasticus sp.]|nr:hypothetical protein [Cycloclasticus sp.]MBL4743928.1 hypothetical protein [Cycloclasticus sp.]
MNYTNDFYNQNTYDNHSHFDHLAQQKTIIEALDCIITEPSDEPLGSFDSDDVPQ